VTEFKHKQVSFTVAVETSLKDRTFGKVVRNGKTHWRNYHRPLKNGKGLSRIDRMAEIVEKSNAFMAFAKGQQPTPATLQAEAPIRDSDRS
jgi:hypothetical protein